LVDKFVNTRFEPSGYTPNVEIRYAKSVLDYIGRWLGGKFISRDYLANATPVNGEASVPAAANAAPAAAALTAVSGVAGEAVEQPRPVAAIDDAPSFSEFGSLMTRNGSCYKCENCGCTSGCS
jgi:ribonucleoside-diphosphate reductase alpha chain